MNISKQIAECLKRYLDGALDREELKTEFRSLHSKMVESKINMQAENHPYISIIHFVTLEMPDFAYTDDEIRYVYHALLGEEGYDLQHRYWFPQNKKGLNDTEQRILEISRKYESNYNNNSQYNVFHNQKSYLEESDLRFIYSLYPDKYTRQEFRKAVKIPNFAIAQMLNLLEAGKYCPRCDGLDSNRAVAQKLKDILYSYENDLPLYCIVSLKNGVTTINIC